MRRVFVTGTGTGVGKTVVAGAIVAALAARGRRVAAFKPVVTGLDEEPRPNPAGDLWPHDDELLASLANVGQARDEVAPWRFGPPVSPHYAAELAGSTTEPAELIAAARKAGAAAGALPDGEDPDATTPFTPLPQADAESDGGDEPTGALVCEGVGGLLVPLTPGYLVRDLVVDLNLPLVIAAAPGLGTINHTLLTVEAARAVGLDVAAVVLTPWRAEPEGIERSNRDTIARFADVRVCGLPPTAPDGLARAGEELPLDEWL